MPARLLGPARCQELSDKSGEQKVLTMQRGGEQLRVRVSVVRIL
jgi:hypothetical protein